MVHSAGAAQRWRSRQAGAKAAAGSGRTDSSLTALLLLALSVF